MKQPRIIVTEPEFDERIMFLCAATAMAAVELNARHKLWLRQRQNPAQRLACAFLLRIVHLRFRVRRAVRLFVGLEFRTETPYSRAYSRVLNSVYAQRLLQLQKQGLALGESDCLPFHFDYKEWKEACQPKAKLTINLALCIII